MPHLNQRPEWENEAEKKFDIYQGSDGFEYMGASKKVVFFDFIRTLLLTEHARWVAEGREKIASRVIFSDFPRDQRTLDDILALPFLSQEPNV